MERRTQKHDGLRLSDNYLQGGKRMALTLTRRIGEELLLRLESDITEAELQQLITQGVYVRLQSIDGQHAKISVEAPLSVTVLRSELLSR